MKIALINENSQASKNTIIYKELKNVANIHGDTVYNYGMESVEENNLTYVQAGLLAAILINSKAADFVVTGCGTGEGACLALNSFPNVLCGHIEDPTDAYLFSQINAGNAVALGYAKGFGWGSELTLRYIFEKLFMPEFGGGYPKERVIPEQANKKISDISSQNQTLAFLKQQGLVDPDIFIAKTNELTKQLQQAKLEKEKLMDAESDMTALQTRDLIDILEGGPEFLDSFDTELFGELVEKIIIESNDSVRFCLKNGLELRESIERTVR